MLINVDSDTLIDTRNTCVVVTGNSAPVLVTLPATPAFGQLVTVVDGDGHSSVYPITVLGNGMLINGETVLLLDVDQMSIDLTCNGTKWVIL
jgi:hypothetical protein